jgi:predicted transcriptional regulator
MNSTTRSGQNQKQTLSGRVRNRGRLDIVHDILQAVSDGLPRTYIMMRCNLSFDQLHRYSSMLEVAGYIRRSGPDERGMTYICTEQGRALRDKLVEVRVLAKAILDD